MDYELDLRPMNLVVSPIIPQAGHLDGEAIADPNVPGFLQRLGFIGNAFDKDGAVPFSEGRDFVLKPFLNHTTETITTELNVQVSVSHPNDTDILRTGYLTILLDGIRLKQGQFSPYNTGVTVFYDGVKDLTTSLLAFVWNGSAPIHIWPHIDYDVHSESADYVEHLQVTESCIVERHLLNYLGVGNPRLRDCEPQSWYPLPPVHPNQLRSITGTISKGTVDNGASGGILNTSSTPLPFDWSIQSPADHSSINFTCTTRPNCT